MLENHRFNFAGILFFGFGRVETGFARAAELQTDQHVAAVLNRAGFLESLHADLLPVTHAVQAGNRDHRELEIPADALQLQHGLVHVLLVRRPLVVRSDDLQIIHNDDGRIPRQVNMPGDAFPYPRNVNVSDALFNENAACIVGVLHDGLPDDFALPVAVAGVAHAVRDASRGLGVDRAHLCGQRQLQRVTGKRFGHQLGARHFQ